MIEHKTRRKDVVKIPEREKTKLGAEATKVDAAHQVKVTIVRKEMGVKMQRVAGPPLKKRRH